MTAKAQILFWEYYHQGIELFRREKLFENVNKNVMNVKEEMESL